MNDEDKKEYRKKQYEKNKQWYKDYYADPVNKERQRTNIQAYHLKNNYGITIEDYTEILDNQNGVCAICGEEEAAMYRNKVKLLSVDHDHETGKVRGLLCANCNLILGHSRDNTSILLSAIDYINKHNN